MILEKFVGNPIIRPHPGHPWESYATFNAAAIYLNKKVHLLYRAIGPAYASVLGYASSKDGLHIDKRLPEPVYLAKYVSEYKADRIVFPYRSGASWIGSEDPRLTKIDDTIYMTYTAFDSYNPPSVALSSIKVNDFLNNYWNWKKPVMLSPRGEINKNWVLFPEKINGKFAILHSLSPEIIIDYVDSLDLNEDLSIQSRYCSKGREDYWDNWMRGIGPPPIKINEGWLILYHAMDKNDPNRYKIGAMILDEHEPTKILYRTHCPLLEPNEDCENQGFKSGVVYSCGAVLIENTLYVYYGGADTVVCVAYIELSKLVELLKEEPTSINEDLNKTVEDFEYSVSKLIK